MNPTSQALDEEVYELFAIRWGRSSPRPERSNFLLSKDLHDDAMPLDFFVWVARSPNRVVLIDSGSEESVCVGRGHQWIGCPSQTLRAIGIDPDSIGDLVITHMHYDHAGNIEKFPAARLHLHESEMAYATGCAMCHQVLRMPYEVDHVCNLVRAVYADRVRFNKAQYQVAPGISMQHVGGHTAGLQVVRVRTRRGHVVLASDAMHFYANADRANPFPVVVDVQAYLDAHATIAELADSPDHVVAGHDPLVLEIYPPFSEDLRGIVARLDVPPRPRLRASGAG